MGTVEGKGGRGGEVRRMGGGAKEHEEGGGEREGAGEGEAVSSPPAKAFLDKFLIF